MPTLPTDAVIAKNAERERATKAAEGETTELVGSESDSGESSHGTSSRRKGHHL